MVLAAADCIAFHLSRALEVLCIEVHIVFFVAVFAKRNTTAAAVADFKVFENPALAPVRTDKSILISGWRRPGCSTVTDFKAAHGDVVEPVYFRHKTVTANQDFNIFLVRVQAFEVAVENSIAASFDFLFLCVYDIFFRLNRYSAVIIILKGRGFSFLFAKPFIFRFFLIPGAGVSLAGYTFI